MYRNCTHLYIHLQDNERIIDAATSYSHVMLFCLEKEYAFEPYFASPKAVLGQNQRAVDLINEGPFSIKQRLAAFPFEFQDGSCNTKFYYFIFGKIEEGKQAHYICLYI